MRWLKTGMRRLRAAVMLKRCAVPCARAVQCGGGGRLRMSRSV